MTTPRNELKSPKGRKTIEREGLLAGLSEENIRRVRNLVPPDNIITSDILKRLREGDHESFKKVYLHWRRPIFKFVFNLTGSEVEADDITQDIFITLWNYKEKIDPDKNIRSFLFLVARRAAYNSHRTRKLRDKYAGSVFDDADYLTSYEIIVEKEAEMIKEALLKRMPPQQRKIFEMAHDEGLSSEEIAHRLGLKRETVYNQLSIARKKIRDAVLLFLVLFAAPFSDDQIVNLIRSLFK